MSVIKEMENEKFDLAKKINEQEAMLSMLESEIEDLRRESDVVENWDIEEEVGMDMNAYVQKRSSFEGYRCSYFEAWVLFPAVDEKVPMHLHPQ